MLGGGGADTGENGKLFLRIYRLVGKTTNTRKARRSLYFTKSTAKNIAYKGLGLVSTFAEEGAGLGLQHMVGRGVATDCRCRSRV